MMLFLNYCIFSGSAEALVKCGGKKNYSSWLLTFSVTHVPNIMKIRQCFLELWLKMLEMFFETQCIYRLFMLSSRLVSMVVTPRWPNPQTTFLTGFSAWWMRQLVSSLAPESSTAAWRVHCSYLTDCNFLTRMLFADSYWWCFFL